MINSEFNQYKKPTRKTNDFLQKISNLEKALGYKFKNHDLLREALSHPSLKQHDRTSTDYERLEMLGDAILGFLITEMIFSNSFLYKEGYIAKIKSYAVSRDIIVKVAEELCLAKYIIMTPGEERSGGKTNKNNMENVMEALLAAIYLDSDMNCVRNIVQDLWAEHIENIDFSSIDAKSTLQEWAQSKGYSIPTYEVVGREGSAHEPLFTVLARVSDQTQTAQGKSIKEAEKNAAKLLVQKLEILN